MAGLGRWRIGITQRLVPACAGFPVRDALDAGWSRWMRQRLPHDLHLPVPNFPQPDDALQFADGWGLNALILAGGEDIGSDPCRDAVERVLLQHATDHHWPVLGVCRGLQLLHTEQGGTLDRLAGHTQGSHAVQHAGGQCEVNSRHRWGIRAMGSDWDVLARSADGGIEAARHRRHRWLGLMWHPERDGGADALCDPWIDALFATTAAAEHA